MFPTSQRLRTTQEILIVLRQGTRRSTGPVSCYFLKRPGTLSRVTVIVDSKVSKKASLRNLYKRRARAILREQNFPAGDLVVRLYKGAEELSFPQLKDYLVQCLLKLP